MSGGTSTRAWRRRTQQNSHPTLCRSYQVRCWQGGYFKWEWKSDSFDDIASSGVAFVRGASRPEDLFVKNVTTIAKSSVLPLRSLSSVIFTTICSVDVMVYSQKKAPLPLFTQASWKTSRESRPRRNMKESVKIRETDDTDFFFFKKKSSTRSKQKSLGIRRHSSNDLTTSQTMLGRVFQIDGRSHQEESQTR